MAEAKARAANSGAPRPVHQRPISPHLTIFRPYINMAMSIVHRATGAANYAGSLLLAIWLVAAAAGDAQFDAVERGLGSVYGLILLFLFTWSLMHHMLGGIRHLIWDTGHGFEVPQIRLLCWGTLFGSLILTGAIWIAGLSIWGARG